MKQREQMRNLLCEVLSTQISCEWPRWSASCLSSGFECFLLSCFLLSLCIILIQRGSISFMEFRAKAGLLKTMDNFLSSTEKASQWTLQSFLRLQTVILKCPRCLWWSFSIKFISFLTKMSPIASLQTVILKFYWKISSLSVSLVFSQSDGALSVLQ